MTDTGLIRPCGSGCTLRGQHRGDVEDDHEPCIPTCPRDCRAHCTGCAPRPVHGNTVCGRCIGRARLAIVRAPSLVGWLLANAMPGQGANDGTPIGTRTPPAPLNVGAVDDADSLHALVTHWALFVAEDHSAGLRGPDISGTRRHDMRPNIERSKGGLQIRIRESDFGGIAGLRPAFTAVNPIAPTQRVAAWLHNWLHFAATRDYAEALVREMHQAVTTLDHRWPRTEEATALPTPCPECGHGSLIRLPPAWPHGPVTITCDHTECGEVIPESRYQWHAKLIAEERKPKKGAAAS